MVYLNNQELTIVKAILQEHLPNRTIRVFGSRAKGNIKPHSDLDLCIMNGAPLSLEALGRLREAFSESDLPMRVDIVEWCTLAPEFQTIIEKNSEMIL